MWTSAAWMLLAGEFGLYFILAIGFAVHAVRRAKETVGVLFALPLVFFLVHLSWGGSFLLGLIRQPR